MLSPESLEELLSLLLRERPFYLLVKEKESCNVVVGIYSSIERACDCAVRYLDKDIKDVARKVLMTEMSVTVGFAWDPIEIRIYPFQMNGIVKN